ncbi:MAG: hypothetical protein QXO69_03725, partial [archaeon]
DPSKQAEMVSNPIIQICGLMLAGFIAGYSYKSYRIRALLISPEKMRQLAEVYAGASNPSFSAVDKIIKITIILMIAAMIYFSVFP